MSNYKIARSALLVIILSIISKLFGFLKEILIGAKFGSGLETDTYILSLTAIILITTLLTKSLNTTLVPILSDIEEYEGKKYKIKYTNTIINLFSIVSFIIIILGYIFTENLIKVFAPGFVNKDQVVLAINLMRIGLPTLFLSMVNGILIGFLHTEGKFKESASLTISLNLTLILFLILFSNKLGIHGLMFSYLLGSIFQTMILIRGVYSVGFKYILILELQDHYLKRMLVLVPPIILSVGVSSINSMIDKSMGSILIEGSITALNYADKLSLLVYGTFVTAITTVLFPKLSKEANLEDKSELKKTFIGGLNLLLLITIPATVGLMVLSNPIVTIVFERGKFDSIATNMTSSALIFTSLGLSSAAVKDLLNNLSYSIKDTKTPLYTGIISVGINITLNIILISKMQHNGLALATSLASISSVFIMIFILKRKLGNIGLANSLVTGTKIIFSSIIMGFIVKLIYGYMTSLLGFERIFILISLSTSIIVGIIVYILILLIFKVEEMNELVRLIKIKTM